MDMFTADSTFGRLGRWDATGTTVPDHPVGTSPSIKAPTDERTDTAPNRHNVALALVGLVAVAVLLTQVTFSGSLSVKG